MKIYLCKFQQYYCIGFNGIIISVVKIKYTKIALNV